MDPTMLAVIVTISLFGAGNIGALIFFAGAVKEHLHTCDDRLDRHDLLLDRLNGIRTDLALREEA